MTRPSLVSRLRLSTYSALVPSCQATGKTSLSVTVRLLPTNSLGRHKYDFLVGQLGRWRYLSSSTRNNIPTKAKKRRGKVYSRKEKRLQKLQARQEETVKPPPTIKEPATRNIVEKNDPSVSPAATAAPRWVDIVKKVRDWITPVRYRYPSSSSSSSSSSVTTAASGARPNYYSVNHAKTFLSRLPYFVVLAVLLLLWEEETIPYSLIVIHGPSMLPTMAADGSDVWVRNNLHVWYRKLYKLQRALRHSNDNENETTSPDSYASWLLSPFLFGLISPYYKVGDLVGLAHPSQWQSLSTKEESETDGSDSADESVIRHQHVSCKRIVGVAGDTVQRYGQYAHLYVRQDPTGLGIVWSQSDNGRTGYSPALLSRWDDQTVRPDKFSTGPAWKRTIVVPPGHVWVEGDCPGLAFDSRHYGPVPVEFLRGKLVARVWPITKQVPTIESTSGQPKVDDWRHRPHPIPLDSETLALFNVHRLAPATKAPQTSGAVE